jgi:prophage regulatory protein
VSTSENVHQEHRRKEQKRDRRRRLRDEKRRGAIAQVDVSSETRLLRLPEVAAITGKRKSSLYADPTFPRPVPIGARAVGWVFGEVRAWVAARVAARDQTSETVRWH